MSSASLEVARPVEAAAPAKRKRTPLLVGGLTALALAGAGASWLLTRGTESTDDAQVEGRIMNVSSRVAGEVLEVHVHDNQLVNEGDVLVQLDPSDFAAKVEAGRGQLAAAQASADAARAALALVRKTAPANLAQAQGGMTAASSGLSSAKAAITQAEADLAAASARGNLARLEFDRARQLRAENAVPQAELDAKRTGLDAAQAQEREAGARLASAKAALSGSGGNLALAHGRLTAAETTDEQLQTAQAQLALANARVQEASAALKLAELDLSYTTIRARHRGVVSRRSVEAGQMVSPDRPLLAIVPLDDVWVVANYKEDQLGEMQPGQPATVEVDTFAGRKLTGRVESLAGGTGARFALLPPDNATGNFVKVVQRVPVLIRLDSPAALALRPGMSATVTVHTGSR